MQTAIDVHSHMLCEEWLALFKAHSGPRFSIRRVTGGAEVIHADGGALPFLAARLDRCWEVIPACRVNISKPPSEYLKRIYADTALYSREALRDTIEAFGGTHVMYGTDFPHTNSDMGPSLARINELPGVTRDNVRGRNALRVFGI